MEHSQLAASEDKGCVGDLAADARGAGTGAPAMRVTLLRDAADLAGLRARWDALLSATPRASVFQSWEWAATWWEVFGDGKQLRLLALEDERGCPAALWPLYRRQVRFLPGCRAKELRFLGTGQEVSPDYMGPVAGPEAQEHLVPALLCWLKGNGREWDVVRLTDVHSEAEWIPHLVESAEAAGLRVREEARARCPYAILPESWEEYLMSLSRNLRHNIRRRLRGLQEKHSPEMFRWDSNCPVSEALDLLGELHRRRWSKVGVPHSFATDDYMRFQKRLAARFQERDWLDLYCLRAGGSIVSMLYIFTYRGVMNVYQSGFEPAWAKHGVGTVLRAYATEDAIRRRLREIDYLKGEHEYKEAWANRERQTVDLLIFNPTPGGLGYLIRRDAERWSRAAARRMLPPGLRGLVRRARNRPAAGPSR